MASGWQVPSASAPLPPIQAWPTLGAMSTILQPWQLLLVGLAGWINREQLAVIEYRKEENRVLREQLAGKRLRLSDQQRVQLAAKAKALGRRVLAELGTIITPDTLLAWPRRLIATSAPGSADEPPECLASPLSTPHANADVRRLLRRDARLPIRSVPRGAAQTILPFRSSI